MAKLSILLCIAIAFMLSFTLREVVAHTGTATFYTPPYVPSACNGYQKDGVMIAAASDAIWDDGAACGRKYKVKCTGATNQSPHPCRGKKYVVVKVVDYCPSGCEGTIDLSQEAFASIADPDAGKIKISFHQYVNLIINLSIQEHDISLADMGRNMAVGLIGIFNFRSESYVCG
ncbi:hypothetical protein Goarm_000203 [Gossypium armourianum]|uniref:Expansin-like EG45 domain-containing protein n=1 Tax=Gossypium armourianum TaxID=34283 RepID=A0A7J9K927_9ROSI|nr:hypothetical protein [Gossypium armourianum]